MKPNTHQVSWSAGKSTEGRSARRVALLTPLIRRREALEANAETTPLQWRELAAEFAALNAMACARMCERKAEG